MEHPPQSRSRLRLVEQACLLGLVMTLGVLLLGRLTFLIPYLDWFSHFPVVYLIVATGFTLILLVTRKWASATLGLLVSLYCLILVVAPFSASRLDPAVIGERRLTLSALNVLASNQAARKTLECIPHADVVGLLETPPSWSGVLDEVESTWPRQWRDLRDNPTGLTVLGDDRIREARWFMLSPGAMPAMHLTIDVDGIPVQLLIIHTMSPQAPGMLNTRNLQLEQLANLINSMEGPVVVIGDLNATTWSPTFTDFLHGTGLRSYRASSGPGSGLKGTWPRWAPSWLRIPIDHCLMRGDVEPVSDRLFEAPNADHLGIFIELAIGEDQDRPLPAEQVRANNLRPVPMFWRESGPTQRGYPTVSSE